MPDEAKMLEGLVVERARETPPAKPRISIIDNLLNEEKRKQICEFLSQGGWRFGWKSDAKADQFSFWHKHFAGNVYPDNYAKDGKEQQYDCADELQRKVPLLHDMWRGLQTRALRGHVLVRCYANGYPFGSEGSLHADSLSDRSFTCVYYPHDKWHPNWGGETVFFNKEKTDIIASVFPRPNRLLMFEGTLQHVARGVSRVCPMMRVTLMFKTEVRDS